MTSKISFQDLERLATDPETPESALRQYFKAAPGATHAFRPVLMPDPATVDIAPEALRVESGLAIGNFWSRMRRRNRFDRRLARGDTRPVLVSEGDSWFQFPILLDDVIDNLSDAYTIRSLGAAGATAEEIIEDGEYRRTLSELKDRVEAFLFSAAGNDVIGEDRDGNPEIQRLLLERTGNQSAAQLINRTGLREKMDFLRGAYETMIREVRGIQGLGALPILVHGYDIPFAGAADDARDPIWTGPDSYLGAPLRDMKIEAPELQREVLTILIDALYGMLDDLAAAHPGVLVVDCRGTLPRRGDWADEIHGTSKGYGRVAQRFAEAIEGARGTRVESAPAQGGRGGRIGAERAGRVVALDPGHGGDTEIGGSSPNNATGPAGTLEKTLTLELGLLAEAELEARGHRVMMTRKSDRNLSLAKRAQVARDNAAEAFVSIHFNGFNVPSVQGTETFHHTNASAASKALAEDIQGSVQRATGLRDRGVKSASFGVIRPDRHAAETAACLLEVSFLTDPAEEQRLLNDARYLPRIAEAIADGIEAYLGEAGVERMGFEAVSDEDLGDATELGAGVPGAGDVALAAAQPPLLRKPGALAARTEAAGLVGIAEPTRFLKAWREFRRRRAGLPNQFEAQIGVDNSLPVAFLEEGGRLARAVARIRTGGIDFRGISGTWVGTGFLIAPNLLLTNNHVLNSVEVSRRAEVQFGFRDGPDGTAEPGEVFRLDPAGLFVTSPAIGGLDYTFVRLIGAADQRWGTIELRRAVFTAEKGERANVIHHPGGRPKRVSLQDNRVLDFDPQLLHYTSDTEGGSSGAPVFDNTWRVIALHHAFDDLPPGVDVPGGIETDIVNEGIKISAIAVDLEAQAGRTESASGAAAVLRAIRGSDSITGYFGARGRRPAAAEGLERVVDAYRGTAEDVDVAFWNVEWFNRNFRERTGDVARIVADLNLDIWAFSETSPEATEALVRHLSREFGHEFDWAASEPDASSGKQTTTVIWNPLTVRGRRVDWPDEIEPFLRADSRRMPDLRFEAIEGKVFNRYPGLFRFEALGRTDAGFAPFDFNLVPLHLKAFDEGAKRRRLASEVLALVIRRMIEKHGASRDWLVGGDVNAELATGQFSALSGAGFVPMSAEDEEEGAISYLKGPRSLIDTIFLSPNLGKRFGAEDFFIYAGDASNPDFVREISDHRPVMARLSLGRTTPPPKPRPGPGPGQGEAEDCLDQLLAQARRDPAEFFRVLAERLAAGS